jgi:hypothetical protein
MHIRFQNVGTSAALHFANEVNATSQEIIVFATVQRMDRLAAHAEEPERLAAGQ